MVERQQVKSKQRVEEHGEVFTNEREVNAMLDLVKSETERIDSRFLERKTMLYKNRCRIWRLYDESYTRLRTWM